MLSGREAAAQLTIVQILAVWAVNIALMMLNSGCRALTKMAQDYRP